MIILLKEYPTEIRKVSFSGGHFPSISDLFSVQSNFLKKQKSQNIPGQKVFQLSSSITFFLLNSKFSILLVRNLKFNKKY